MNLEFYKKKVEELSDESLLDLVRISNNPSNKTIFDLAKEECEKRNLNITSTDLVEKTTKEKTEDLGLLQKWNWGAFFLAPIWALNHKMEIWTVLWFIPLVNFYVMIHLGLNGNRLAYLKSEIQSPTEFMILQSAWIRGGFRILWIPFVGVILFSIIQLFLALIKDILT